MHCEYVSLSGWTVVLSLKVSKYKCFEWQPAHPLILMWVCMCLVNILLSDIDLYTYITLGCSHLSSLGVNTSQISNRIWQFKGGVGLWFPDTGYCFPLSFLWMYLLFKLWFVYHMRSQSSFVIVTMLWTGQYEIRILAGARDFALL